MNTLKIIFMLAALSGILLLVGALVGGRIGLVMALILSAVMNIGGYWYSDRIVLKMYNANSITSAESPVLYGAGTDGAGTVALIAIAIVAPVAATLVQMAISRSREYDADEGAAKMTGNPEALAGSLEKLSLASRKIPLDVNPATAHMFIVNPLSGNMIMNLFSTHPLLEKRIARLGGMK